jgi:hypothetical protein
VANVDYSNAVGEFKGQGINNLVCSGGDVNTLSQDVDEKILKGAPSNKDSRPRATEEMTRRKKIKTERAELERNGTPKENEGKLTPQIGLNNTNRR